MFIITILHEKMGISYRIEVKNIKVIVAVR